MPDVTGNIASSVADEGPMDLAVGVAVLTWRGEAITRRCLESLRVLPQWPQRILVVDSASGTGEGERLAAEFGIESTTLERNDAVAGGYNAAIEWAMRHGYGHVLLLNNDTTIEGDVLTPLLGASGGSIAAVGPVIIDDEGTVNTAGGRISLWSGRARALRAPEDTRPYRVDWIDGSAMFVNVAAAADIGGLSTDFHLYWEETDWCARARMAGYRIVVQPAASIRHTRGATVPGIQMRTWSLRNALLYLRRHASVAQLTVALPAYVLVRIPVYCLRVTLRHGPASCVRGLREALGWNLRDAARRGIRIPARGPALEPEQ